MKFGIMTQGEKAPIDTVPYIISSVSFGYPLVLLNTRNAYTAEYRKCLYY